MSPFLAYAPGPKRKWSSLAVQHSSVDLSTPDTPVSPIVTNGILYVKTNDEKEAREFGKSSLDVDATSESGPSRGIIPLFPHAFPRVCPLMMPLRQKRCRGLITTSARD